MISHDRIEQSGHIRCHLLRSTAELEGFYQQWQELWAANREATPFQHPAWLLPWWQAFGNDEAGRELCCVIAVDTEQNTPVAFLPFYIYSEPGTKERQLLLLGAGTSDYLDGLFARNSPEQNTAAAHAALTLLFSQTEWDVLHAAQLRPASVLLEALQALASECTEVNAAPLYTIESWAAEPTSRLPAATLNSLPVKIRRNALYYRNRAQRQGELTLHTAGENDCLAVFDELVALHRERWEAAGQLGVLSDPAVLAHHRAALPLLARVGLLRLITLRLGAATLGILYSLVDSPHKTGPRTQYFYLPAFSIAHADLRPGTLLNALAIDYAAQEGVQTIDLLRGDEPYKQLWHAERFPTCGITLRRPVFPASLHTSLSS